MRPKKVSRKLALSDTTDMLVFHDSIDEAKNQRYYRHAEHLASGPDPSVVFAPSYGLWQDWGKDSLEGEATSAGSWKRRGQAEWIALPGNPPPLAPWASKYRPAGHFMAAAGHYLSIRKAVGSGSFRRAYGHSIWGGLTCLMLKRSGLIRRFVYEDLDYYPGFYSEDAGMKTMLARAEDLVCREADLIVSVSEELAALRKERGARHVIVSRNGVDLALFRRAQHPRNRGRRLIYTGTLDRWSGLDLLVRAVAIARGSLPDLELHIFGSEWKDGFFGREVLPLIDALDLGKNVVYFGSRPYTELPDYLADASIGVIPNRDNLLRRYACPLKIYEYLAAGLPVICTNIGEMGRVVRDSGAGLGVAFNPAAFADAIVATLTDPAAYDAMVRRAVAYAEECDWKARFDIDERAAVALEDAEPASPRQPVAVAREVFKELFGIRGSLLMELGGAGILSGHRRKWLYGGREADEPRGDLEWVGKSLKEGLQYTFSFPVERCSVKEAGAKGILRSRGALRFSLDPNEYSGAYVCNLRPVNLHGVPPRHLKLSVTSSGDLSGLVINLLDVDDARVCTPLNEHLVEKRLARKANQYIYNVPLNAFGVQGERWISEHISLPTVFDPEQVKAVGFTLVGKRFLSGPAKPLVFDLHGVWVTR